MKIFVLITTILAFVVVVFGAYVRLSDAGLGCPDWPGCYGQWSPDLLNPLDSKKAWIEMIHRYLAGTLGLLILVLAVIRRRCLLSWLLVGLVVFQALLGMWTVTLKLHPLVVMAHLLGGLATLGLLWWMTLQSWQIPPPPPLQKGAGEDLKMWSRLSLIILVCQITLGGWVSANYASLACPDFPTCLGHWWPPMNLKEAFSVGISTNEARITIHMMHRIGAVITFLLLGLLGTKCLKNRLIKKIGFVLLVVLGVQVTLGLANIFFALPLAVATAHNGVAALLLLCTLTIFKNDALSVTHQTPY